MLESKNMNTSFFRPTCDCQPYAVIIRRAEPYCAWCGQSFYIVPITVTVMTEPEKKK